MANKTEKNLRAHLFLFDPEYPIKKGYVAQLLLLDRNETKILREVTNILQVAEPKKHLNEERFSANLQQLKNTLKDKRYNLTKEWPSLVRLCLQTFPITFRSIFEPHISVQPVHALTLQSTSSARSELACTTADVELDISELLQSGMTFTSVKSPSCSILLPRKFKRDCESCVNCVSEQSTNINILDTNINILDNSISILE